MYDQAGDVTKTKELLCSFLLRADRRIGQAFFEDMLKQGAFVSKRECFAKGAEGRDRSGDWLDRRRKVVTTTLSLSSSPGVDLMRVLNGRDPEPPTPSKASRKLAEELSPELDRLSVAKEK